MSNDVHVMHCGDVSSHFFFRRRHVQQLTHPHNEWDAMRQRGERKGKGTRLTHPDSLHDSYFTSRYRDEVRDTDVKEQVELSSVNLSRIECS